MTQLLISVKNPAEALLAQAAGADIIDLKDPSQGALGALDINISTEIVRTVVHANNLDANHHAELSTTVGENHASVAELLHSMEIRAALGFDYIKIVVTDFMYTADFKQKIDDFLQKNIKVIVVFYADETTEHSPDLSVLSQLKKIGIHGVMLDTQSKQVDLVALKNEAYLQDFVAMSKKNDLICGFAGSLKPQHIDLLRKINATYIGFRGGVCNNNARNTDLNSEKVNLVVKMLRENHKNTANVNKYLGLALHS
jgi:(5-formylfuran-3-yl)methyl phosphate synthase